jgi:hypothetical protein
MSSTNLPAIIARFNKKNANIMARLNKINANIANLKGKTRKNIGINSKSIDEQIEKLKHQIFIYGKLMDKAFDDNKADEYQKFEKLMKDAKIQMLIKGDEKSIGYSLNIAGGKRNKKSRRKTRRN